MLHSMSEEKLLGNAAFSAGRYEEAITHYSAGLEQSGAERHVLLSNRSASHAALRQFWCALKDAEECTTLEPKWPKGHLRKGTAHLGLLNLSAAYGAYTKALEVSADDKTLSAINRGLASVDSVMTDMMRIAKSSELVDEAAHSGCSALRFLDAEAAVEASDPDSLAVLRHHTSCSVEGICRVVNEEIERHRQISGFLTRMTPEDLLARLRADGRPADRSSPDIHQAASRTGICLHTTFALSHLFNDCLGSLQLRGFPVLSVHNCHGDFMCNMRIPLYHLASEEHMESWVTLPSQDPPKQDFAHVQHHWLRLETAEGHFLVDLTLPQFHTPQRLTMSTDQHPTHPLPYACHQLVSLAQENGPLMQARLDGEQGQATMYVLRHRPQLLLGERQSVLVGSAGWVDKCKDFIIPSLPWAPTLSGHALYLPATRRLGSVPSQLGSLEEQEAEFAGLMSCLNSGGVPAVGQFRLAGLHFCAGPAIEALGGDMQKMAQELERSGLLNYKRCPACSAAATLRCARCQAIWYCSAACQKAHWKAHKPSCNHT